MGGVIVDNTERKKIEKDLKKSEDWFRSLIESTSDWIWELDIQANFTYVSPQVKDVLGYEPEEIIGKMTGFDLMLPGDAKKIRAEFEGFVSAAEPFEGMINVNIHKSGRQVIMESSGRPFFDDTGKILGYRGIDRDITERKKAERELVKAKKRADIANQAKSQFLAAMSHDIRTPMNAILGMGEVLIDSEMNPEQRSALKVLTHAGESLLALINDILDLSKVEAGQLQMESISFDLYELVEANNHIISQKAHSRGIELNLDIQENCPQFVVGDPQRLRQILLNLIGNSIKFTKHGSITVKVELQDKDLLLFKVSDTGVGIPEQQLELIFNPYRQALDSTSRRFGGTGLGLAICKQLVQAMGGNIWVESEVNKGSTFYFTARLPKSDEPLSVDRLTRVTRTEDRQAINEIYMGNSHKNSVSR